MAVYGLFGDCVGAVCVVRGPLPHIRRMSQFAFQDPETGAIHRLADYDGKVNMFRATGQKGHELWHCIYSLTYRWSIGFQITDLAAENVLRALEAARGLEPGALGRPPTHEPTRR